jgi:glycosyltransferase involved in cell wall biosynthesis
MGEILNQYDLIFFCSAGYTGDKSNISYLQGLQVPFVTGIYDDLGWRRYPDILSFLEHPQFKGMVVLDEGFEKTRPGNFPKVKQAAVGQLVDPDLLLGKHKDLCKEKIVGTLSGWSPFKNTEYLCKAAPRLNEMGYKIVIHGFNHVWSYYDQIKKEYPTGWEYRGVTHEVPRVMEPWQYYYDVISRKKAQVSPRLELAAIEAASVGCKLIISDEGTPKWLTESVRVPFKEISRIEDFVARSEDKVDTQKAWNEIVNHYHPDRVLEKILRLL